MGTRAGDHAAALDFYMMQKEDYSPQEIDSILNKKEWAIRYHRKVH